MATSGDSPAQGTPSFETGFVGRAQELAVIAQCAEQAASGVPWLVAIEGEPGIGKTALLRHAVRALDGFTVWWASSDAAEQDYPFGVLEQWVTHVPKSLLERFPVLSRIPQEMSSVEVGAEVLRLLGAAEKAGPIALVIDDVQWADEASMRALRFLVRRWWTERVLVLLTVRAGSKNGPEADWDEAEGWRRLLSSGSDSQVLSLTGLNETEVQQLAAASTLSLPSEAASRLHRHTGGHPLYLRSILTEATEAHLADPDRSPPVPNSLAETVRRTLQRLEPDSRAVLEALAVLDTRAPLARVGSLGGVRDAADALGPLIDTGLVQWWPSEPSSPVRIRHALQRDAVYETISPGRRQELHGLAASLVDADAAWAHRVAAADGFDSILADRLQKEAEHQAAQGRAARAARLLLWSADLSSDRAVYEHRLLSATTHLLLANDHLRGFALQEAAERCAPSPARTCVLGRLAFGRGDLITAGRLLTQALAEAEAAHDTESAALAAGWLGAVYVWEERGDDALPVLRRALGGSLTDPRSVSYIQYMLFLASLWCGGPRAAEIELRDRVPALPDDLAQLPFAQSSLLRPWGILHIGRGDLRSCIDILGTLTERQRSGAIADTRSSDYFILASAQYQVGAWNDAGLNAERALTLAATNGPLFGRAPGHAFTSLLAAARGDWDSAEEHLSASQHAARASALATDSIYPVLAQAGIAHARDDHSALVRTLRPLNEAPLHGQRRGWLFWWLPLYADGLVATGDIGGAEEVVQRIRGLGYSCHTMVLPWLTGRIAAARNDTALAAGIYRDALSRPPDPNENPLHRAGVEHAYGKLLLTGHDAHGAIEHLRAAHNRYQALGAVPYAERAARDLATAGVHEQASTGGSTALTERERAVAYLVAQGMTNQETAKELYVSAKTVEYHLGHIFTKLGLTSRRQLRRALATTA